MQNRLPGLACATDAVSGLPHDDRLAWGVPEARVFSAAGALPTVLDWKSCKALSPEFLLQAGAYRHAAACQGLIAEQAIKAADRAAPGRDPDPLPRRGAPGA